MALDCVLVADHGVVAALHYILGPFDLVIVSLQDDVLATENGVF